MNALGSPDLRSLIIATAQAIGAHPLDLATAISYETGGTFDPLQPGPTTQWGQHRGLIQFGEPQAQQYGVDFSSPEAALLSQLGPDGAIVRYFRDRGFRPGMSGLDLYSTINAGAPGRYGASDADNGGAPGDVAEKWANQMAGHRENAERLLGGEWAPNPGIAGAFGAGPPPSGGGNALARMAPSGAYGMDPLLLSSLTGLMQGQNALAQALLDQQSRRPSAANPWNVSRPDGALDPAAFMVQPTATPPMWGFAPGTSPFL